MYVLPLAHFGAISDVCDGGVVRTDHHIAGERRGSTQQHHDFEVHHAPYGGWLCFFGAWRRLFILVTNKLASFSSSSFLERRRRLEAPSKATPKTGIKRNTLALINEFCRTTAG
jgi:hypothetical protein